MRNPGDIPEGGNVILLSCELQFLSFIADRVRHCTGPQSSHCALWSTWSWDLAHVRSRIFPCFRKLKVPTHCCRHRKEIKLRFMGRGSAALCRIMIPHRELLIVSALTVLRCPPALCVGWWDAVTDPREPLQATRSMPGQMIRI
jgi:hypothetical protein